MISYEQKTLNGMYSLIYYYINRLRRVRLDKETLRKEIKRKRIVEQARDIPADKEDVRTILKYASREHKAARVLAALSSGLNPVDFLGVRAREVTLSQGIAMVKGFRAKNGQAFETWF